MTLMGDHSIQDHNLNCLVRKEKTERSKKDRCETEEERKEEAHNAFAACNSVLFGVFPEKEVKSFTHGVASNGSSDEHELLPAQHMGRQVP